jgi:hypothetical protein
MKAKTSWVIVLFAILLSFQSILSQDAIVRNPPPMTEAKESDLLAKADRPWASTEGDHGYYLFKEIPLNLVTGLIVARIWNTDGGSWPGWNYQIIEVLKDGKRVSSKRVGDEPMMVDAWGALDHNSSGEYIPYVYILCRDRHRFAQGIYVYRINPNLSISDEGVVFTKDELEKEDARNKELDHK